MLKSLQGKWLKTITFFYSFKSWIQIIANYKLVYWFNCKILRKLGKMHYPQAMAYIFLTQRRENLLKRKHAHLVKVLRYDLTVLNSYYFQKSMKRLIC